MRKAFKLSFPTLKKGFTLVELVVVITILMILGTISFISLQNYSKDARDSKRLHDIRSILTKLNVENVKGTPYSDMLKNKDDYTRQIDGNPNASVTSGIVNFEYIREARENFLDPKTNGDYDFATAKGVAEYNSKDQSYDFLEGRYYSEIDNREVIMGNYYKFQPTDTDHLFETTLTGPNNGGTVNPSNGSCAVLGKPVDNGHIYYNEGNPTAPDTLWTQSDSGDCTYKCKTNYSGINCDTLVLPNGVVDFEPSTIGCPEDNPDIIAIIDGKRLRIAGCNASGGTGSYEPAGEYTEIGEISGQAGTTHYYYTWQNAINWCANKGAGWRLPTQLEFNNSDISNNKFGMIQVFGWNTLNTSTVPYSALQTKSPYYIYPAGYLLDEVITNQGILGYYWSSEQNNSTRAYHLHFTSSFNGISFGHKTRYALAVRCVKTE